MSKGDFQLARGLNTREAVRQYYLTHPCCFSADCAKALGLRVATVTTHAARIRQEWRGQPEPAE